VVDRLPGGHLPGHTLAHGARTPHHPTGAALLFPAAIALPIWKREEGDGEKRDRYREGRGEIPGFDRSFSCVSLFCFFLFGDDSRNRSLATKV
jgi:hypothetical protein